VLTGECTVVLWIFSQEMYIFVALRETPLNVSGSMLTVENKYNSEGCWHLEAEVTRV
jgi:hypothetical protein